MFSLEVTMSDQQSKFYAPLLSVFGGAMAAGLLGGVIGFIVVLSWNAPESIESDFHRFVWRVFAGVMTGGVGVFPIGVALAWHGGMLGAIVDRAEGAPAWGVITGVVMGASLGPLTCGFFGLLFGNLASGVVLGLVLGPLAGVIAWQTGFWSADYFRGTKGLQSFSTNLFSTSPRA